MKKIHSILLGMGLITGGLMLAGWTSGETVTLEEIDTATADRTAAGKTILLFRLLRSMLTMTLPIRSMWTRICC